MIYQKMINKTNLMKTRKTLRIDLANHLLPTLNLIANQRKSILIEKKKRIMQNLIRKKIVINKIRKLSLKKKINVVMIQVDLRVKVILIAVNLIESRAK